VSFFCFKDYREDRGVGNGRKHVPKQRASVDRAEAVQEYREGSTAQGPRQRPNQREQNAHGAEGRARGEGYGVGQQLTPEKKRRKRPYNAIIE